MADTEFLKIKNRTECNEWASTSIKCLKDYPLSCLVKHFDEIRLVAKCDVPDEWLELNIVGSFIQNFGLSGNVRVLVVKEKEA